VRPGIENSWDVLGLMAVPLPLRLTVTEGILKALILPRNPQSPFEPSSSWWTRKMRFLGLKTKMREPFPSPPSNVHKIRSLQKRRQKKESGTDLTGACRSTVAVVGLGLSALREGSDVCPPLKSLLGLVLHVIDLFEEIKDTDDFAERTQMKAFQLLDDLAKEIPDDSVISAELTAAITDLSSNFGEIIREVSFIRKRGFLARLVRVKSHRAKMKALARRLDDAIDAFRLRSQIRVEVAMQKLARTSQSEICNGSSSIAPPRFVLRPGYFTC